MARGFVIDTSQSKKTCGLPRMTLLGLLATVERGAFRVAGRKRTPFTEVVLLRGIVRASEMWHVGIRSPVIHCLLRWKPSAILGAFPASIWWPSSAVTPWANNFEHPRRGTDNAGFAGAAACADRLFGQPSYQAPASWDAARHQGVVDL